MTVPPRERARAALLGLAIGDALGMPTQSLPRREVAARYGPLLDRLHPAAADHPIARGLPAGTVTDDTEQALLLADCLVAGGGRVDPRQWAERLLGWEADMRRRGSADLLGPSTRRALDELLAGADPRTTGRHADTNGAAMRIAPVGLAVAAGDSERLLDAVIAASAVTHGTGLALSAAAAVATVVSSGLDGADVVVATDLAVDAARRAAERGAWVAGAHVADRIERAVALCAGRPADEVVELLDTSVGTSVRANESVPAAFAALHAAGSDPWLACRIGASAGGDTDTVAAIAGAMAGAVYGAAAFPSDAVHLVLTRNALRLDEAVDGLLALRNR